LKQALDNVGASRLPKDPEFLILVDNLSAMGSSSERLKEKLVHYMSSVKGLFSFDRCLHSESTQLVIFLPVLTRSSHGVADEFKEFYEKTPENPFTTAALKNELEMAKLDDSKFTKFVRSNELE
jgi:hypothetical protein